MSIRVPLMYEVALVIIDAVCPWLALVESASARSGVGSALSGECGVAPFRVTGELWSEPVGRVE